MHGVGFVAGQGRVTLTVEDGRLETKILFIHPIEAGLAGFNSGLVHQNYIGIILLSQINFILIRINRLFIFFKNPLFDRRILDFAG